MHGGTSQVFQKSPEMSLNPAQIPAPRNPHPLRCPRYIMIERWTDAGIGK